MALFTTQHSGFDDRLHSIQKIVKENGYPFEEHSVVTDDDYVLQMHRIPSRQTEAPVVLLHHGLMATSLNWVINEPEKAVAFQLADAGYDVWMANSRGNSFSDTHLRYHNTEREYWQFDWETMGTHDVPAEIEFIKKVTHQSNPSKKLTYIGHSQGTT